MLFGKLNNGIFMFFNEFVQVTTTRRTKVNYTFQVINFFLRIWIITSCLKNKVIRTIYFNRKCSNSFGSGIHHIPIKN